MQAVRNNVQKKRVLVFSKTEGYRHASIETGKIALQKMGEIHGFEVDTTENAYNFSEANLGKYSAVIFLNTTKDVLDNRQQADFERYIQSGGGFVGIHAATDTEYDWPWYNKLVGAWFSSHPDKPNVREGKMTIVNHDHPSTACFGDQSEWIRKDEFYNFKSIYHGPDDGIIPLIEIDESSYKGGTNGDFHPMAWYHEFDGGRAFYTNFGHTKETFSEPKFLEHLWGGIQYVIGENLELNYDLAHTNPLAKNEGFTLPSKTEKVKQDNDTTEAETDDAEAEVADNEDEDEHTLRSGIEDKFHKPGAPAEERFVVSSAG